MPPPYVSPAPPPLSVRARHGFTLIELLLVVVIIGALAALAIPNYQRVTERARIVKAIGDIDAIGQSLTEYWLENSTYPPSLADVGWDNLRDPWGNPYQYLDFSQAKGNLQPRKDKFLHPLNSTYDLYSMGPDGESKTPLTAKASRDDIIRANDGDYIGVAELY